MSKRFCPYSGERWTVAPQTVVLCGCGRSWNADDLDRVARRDEGIVVAIPGHRVPRGNPGGVARRKRRYNWW